MRYALLSAGLAALAVLPANLSWAQVTSDGTLNTTVSSVGTNFTITNGTVRGSNLFHSFGQLSVPTNGSATFDLVNTPPISTIFSRVTGGSVSHIDGAILTLNSNSPVSLFLINPAGILFGPSARLNVSGSFIATTANSIKFADGTELSAVNPTAGELLTVSVPIGLQFGTIPSTIQMQGSGHLLTTTNPTFAPFTQAGAHPGLAVSQSRTLALVGGSIDLQGGVLTAPGGRVELGSVDQAGLVSLRAVGTGFQLGYGGVSNFGEIQLGNRSLVNASGTIAGAIQVQGRRVALQGGSQLWIQNRGLQPSGDLRVVATEALQIRGISADYQIRSGLITETLGTEVGGNILVSTPRLLVQAGGAIAPRTFSAAQSGNLTIQAAQIEVSGFAPQAPSIFSAASALTGRTGRAGDVAVVTQQLSLLEGGFLGSATAGNGSGGNVTVNADTVVVSGTTPAPISSTLAAASLGAGTAGNLTLNTRTLTVYNSGLVVTSSVGAGAAGTLIVQASESVEVAGRASNLISGSTLGSLATQPRAGLSEVGVGTVTGSTSGNVFLTTTRLQVSDQGIISASNKQSDNAGTLHVKAAIILLDNGSIQVTTLRGEGGNLDIQAQRLQLRHGSLVTATALGSGNGGNITINAPIVLGAENSDIIANAFQGQGGNIQITTQGIFGLKFRPQLTPENDITASSQFGVNGIVQVNTIGVDPSAGLVEFPLNLVDASRQITAGCSRTQDSSFVATGRGGVPQNPTQESRTERLWQDLRDLSGYQTPARTLTQATAPRSPSPIVEASTLEQTNGQLELVAANERNLPMQAATCAGAIASPRSF